MVSRSDIEEARARLGIAGQPQGFAPQQPQGPFGFLSPVADLGRAIVPQGVRDVAGMVAQDLLSAEEFLNVPGFQLGTGIRGQLERVPRVGGALGLGFDIGLAPATLIPGAAGGRISVAAGRGLGGRLGAEAAVALGTVGAAAAAQRGVQEAERRGLPVPGVVRAGLPLAAGLAVGIRGIKALQPARAAEQAAEAAQRFGDLAQPINKLSSLIEEAKPVLAQQGVLRSQELARRAGRIRTSLRANGADREAFRRAGALRGGELPTQAFEAPERLMTGDEINRMFRFIDEHPAFEGREFTKLNTGEALNKVLAGQLPQPAELGLLEDVFGQSVVRALLAKRPRSQKVVTALIDLANVPRAVMASFDISAPFRQGALLVTRKEFWGAWKPMLKAFGSETYARAVEDVIRNDKLIQDAIVSVNKGGPGLYISPFGRAGALGKREEAFISRIATSIPGVGRSERAFVTFLNKLRADTYINTARKLARNGAGSDDYRSLARWLNVATGRGSLPDSQLAAASSAIFFSPRLLAARLQTPFELKLATPAVRREVARDIVGFVGVGVGALTLLHLSGQASIELDPRSSDFGKGKIGSVRYDPWGGFQPIARYIAQFITGTRKTTGTGDILPAGREQTIGRFAQSKLAPVPGLVLDLFRGQTFLGESVGFTPTRETGEAVVSRLVPLFIQDVGEAAREEGLVGVLMGLPGATGISVQAFTTLSDIRNEVAGMRFQKRWDELTGAEQQLLEVEFNEELSGAKVRSDFADRKDEIETDIRMREQELAVAITQGADPRAINNALGELNRERTIRINEAFIGAGFEARDEDDPISRVYASRELATRNGIVDLELLDQFEQDALEQLTPDERRKWEDRRRFVHDGDVEHIFRAKEFIADSGYWGIQRDAFEQLLSLIQRRDSSIQTYQQLEMAIRLAEREGNRGRRRMLNGIKTRIDRITTRKRKTLRRKDPLLQEAGVTVYGWRPLR